MLRQHWEQESKNWFRWARTPEHDSYWWYRDSFLAILPRPGARTLDLGCGEGRVTRDLSALGHRVWGLDSSPTLVGYARNEEADGYYLVADASSLPIPAEAFDLVVAHCSFMDFDDMSAAMSEVGRVPVPSKEEGSSGTAWR